jgi:hypothetical protein
VSRLIAYALLVAAVGLVAVWFTSEVHQVVNALLQGVLSK